nr:hypothetical protein [Sinorhizobium meliloti]
MAGVEMQPIRYKGSGPALNDVLGNQVPIMFDNLPRHPVTYATGNRGGDGMPQAD